jgi:hypothetical protein
MTSLSSKLSDYKSKGQQPSIALTTTSEAKKASETTTISPKQATETKQQGASPNAKPQPQQTTAKPNSPFSDAKSFATPSKSGTATGWDDNEWKEMDDDNNDNDDDQMEPLEDFYGKTSQVDKNQTKTWNSGLTSANTKLNQPSNWSQPSSVNPYTNEEDMFTALVKDVSSWTSTNQSPKTESCVENAFQIACSVSHWL